MINFKDSLALLRPKTGGVVFQEAWLFDLTVRLLVAVGFLECAIGTAHPNNPAVDDLSFLVSANAADSGKLYYWSGSSWVEIEGATAKAVVYRKLSAGVVYTGAGLKEIISIVEPQPTLNATKTLFISCPFGFVIDRARAMTASGSATVQIKKNGTTVLTVGADTTPSNVSGPVTFLVGDTLSYTISAASAATDMTVQIETART